MRAYCLFLLLIARVERERARHRQWKRTNRSWCSRYFKRWNAAHRAQVRKNHRRHYRKAMTKPDFKIERLLRTRIQKALAGRIKSVSTFQLLGCSLVELRRHLESKFKPGMTWENRGAFGWHVDHIKPCALFDLSDPAQQGQCFHYTNLQPLWWNENLAKGKK